MEIKVEEYNRLLTDPYGYYLARKSGDLDAQTRDYREMDRKLTAVRLCDKGPLTAKVVDRAVDLYAKFWAAHRVGVDAARIFRSARRRVSYASDSCSGQLDRLIQIHNDKYIDDCIELDTSDFRDEDVEAWLRDPNDHAAQCYRRVYRIYEILSYLGGIDARSITAREDEESMCIYLYSMLVASLLFDGDLRSGAKAARVFLKTSPKCEFSRSTFKGMTLHAADIHGCRELLKSTEAVVGKAFSCRPTFSCKDKAAITTQARLFVKWDEKSYDATSVKFGCEAFDKLFVDQQHDNTEE